MKINKKTFRFLSSPVMLFVNSPTLLTIVESNFDKQELRFFNTTNETSPKKVTWAFEDKAQENFTDKYGKNPLFMSLENLIKRFPFN